MEILYFDCLDSTQKYLYNLIKHKKINKEVAIVAKKQTDGIGSRANRWEAKEGDLLVSFSIKKENLPSDLPVSSASIYFAYLMKETLNLLGEKCWLKWPNDIYKKNKKCGGVITQLVGNYYIVGIGVNLVKRDEKYNFCHIEKDVKNVLNSYFMLLKEYPKWQEIFSKYRLEFEMRKEFFTTVNGQKRLIKNAKLCKDGSLLIENNERIYSLR